MDGGTNGFVSLIVPATTKKISFVQKERINASAGRRLIIHKTLKRVESPETFARTVFDDKERVMFISHCLALADEHAFPPATLQMALLTMFRSSTRTIT